MVVDFFGLVLLSLSVCLPNIFLDGSNLRLVNGLIGTLLLSKLQEVLSGAQRPGKHGRSSLLD